MSDYEAILLTYLEKFSLNTSKKTNIINFLLYYFDTLLNYPYAL